ncbi:MAG: DUF2339 domain-containing protein [Pyrinomonadaceae bacterium]|nr:DUF2339 domain-containing protein [Pyrinomonadaceae bacterium]
MNETERQIAELEARIDQLVRSQIDFQKEITAIRGTLTRLRAETGNRNDVSFATPPPPKAEEPRPAVPPPFKETPAPSFGYRYAAPETEREPAAQSDIQKRISEYKENARNDLERFVGENLISKIGVVVLIIGVGIGVKYSIDNNLISPLARIIAGYLVGFGLVGLAIKLKPKYHNFSSALISGGMAIMYFVTYFGYSAYGLISQPAAFGLMAMFTAFTVTAAIVYNRQVIAHIGLVGAYAVPFLLSSDTGNYLFLFSYMAVINSGILAISVKRYWTPIFYTASVFTWLIFLGWFATKYTPESHFALALAFTGIFGTIFYATKVVHSLVHREHDEAESTISAAVTAFILFSFTFAIAATAETTRQYWMVFGFLAAFAAAAIATSFRFFDRWVAYMAFAFVWAIFLTWFNERFVAEEHTLLASVFTGLFFAIFYVGVMAHRFVTPGVSILENAALVLTNSFIFYGFGYAILDSNAPLRDLLGLFTVAHGLFHLGVALGIGRVRDDAADVVNVLTILVLTFAAIAVPVQFDGNVVTMVWSVEAALLFWLGRTKHVPVFEYFSFPVMVLAAGSMFADWAHAYSERSIVESELNRQPLANGDLVTAFVLVIAFAGVFVVNRNRRDESPLPAEATRFIGASVAALAIFVLYNALRMEIGNYFHLQAVAAGSWTGDIQHLNIIWQLNYTMAFLTAMAVVNLRKFRSAVLALASVALSATVLALLATFGMAVLSNLRDSYLVSEGGAAFYSSHIAVRYVSYALAAGLIFASYRYLRSGLLDAFLPSRPLSLGFEIFVSIFILVIASGELLNLMEQFFIPDGFKLGLSILWGIYALAVIAYGIARGKKHLRIGAIGLLAITLMKLFFYDAADLDTIPKTILFVTLGITLLIASFLYNKYKNVIAANDAAAEHAE